MIAGIIIIINVLLCDFTLSRVSMAQGCIQKGNYIDRGSAI